MTFTIQPCDITAFFVGCFVGCLGFLLLALIFDGGGRD